MQNEILLVAESVSSEKGLAQEVIFEAIESALATATKRRYLEPSNILVNIDKSTGEYETFRFWEVVEEEEFEDDFTFVDPATKKPVTHATETEGTDIESGDDDSDDAEGTSQIPSGEEEFDSEPAENADNIEADAE